MMKAPVISRVVVLPGQALVPKIPANVSLLFPLAVGYRV